VQAQLAELYLQAADFQRVCVLCAAASQPELRALLGESSVELWDYETDDVWCRDYGPLFVFEAAGKELLVSDWRFNAWGEKYEQWNRDDGATTWIASRLGLRCLSEKAVLEGGAIECNGAGVLLTTEAVLLNNNRGEFLDKAVIKARLSAGLGISQILWLGGGLAGDDTDGHIDNLARFYEADAILYAAVPPKGHENHAVLADNEKRIQNFTTQSGKLFKSRSLPMPECILHEGKPLAASYLNYLVLNGAVLVPTYGQPKLEQVVMKIIGECYPGRKILGFDCCEIIREGGALHCLSQHQPRIL
jgi:agmatine deiminase